MIGLEEVKRFCKGHECMKCGFWHSGCDLMSQLVSRDGVEELIADWCEKNPVKNRLGEFLKVCPNAAMGKDGYPEVCVEEMDAGVRCEHEDNCTECKRKYWEWSEI